MEIQNLTNNNGIIKGTVSIPDDLFSSDNFGRWVVSYREKYDEYRSVGKMDTQNMRILHLDMPLFDNQQEFKLYIDNGHNKNFIGTLYRSDIENVINISTPNITSNDISWWEFGHSDEFFLKSLFLLPFRLIAYAIMIPLGIGFWAIRFVYRIIASIFVILVSIIVLMPIKIILFIISFGHWDWFEERFIGRLEDIWD